MRYRATSFIALGISLLVSGMAQATPSASGTGASNLPQPAARLGDARPEMAPIAFLKFCMAYKDQCQSTSSDALITLTSEIWDEISSVNSAINRRIRPDADKGAFDWSLDTSFGNCNDYAVQKRKALLDLGLPASALSLATVTTPGGIGHLVLTLRTDRGDFVLDNLRASIVAWNRTGYRWHKRQSAADPQTWVSVNTQAAPVQMARQVSKPHPVPVPRPVDIASAIDDDGSMRPASSSPGYMPSQKRVVPADLPVDDPSAGRWSFLSPGQNAAQHFDLWRQPPGGAAFATAIEGFMLHPVRTADASDLGFVSVTQSLPD